MIFFTQHWRTKNNKNSRQHSKTLVIFILEATNVKPGEKFLNIQAGNDF